MTAFEAFEDSFGDLPPASDDFGELFQQRLGHEVQLIGECNQ